MKALVMWSVREPGLEALCKEWVAWGGARDSHLSLGSLQMVSMLLFATTSTSFFTAALPKTTVVSPSVRSFFGQAGRKLFGIGMCRARYLTPFVRPGSCLGLPQLRLPRLESSQASIYGSNAPVVKSQGPKCKILASILQDLQSLPRGPDPLPPVETAFFFKVLGKDEQPAATPDASMFKPMPDSRLLDLRRSTINQTRAAP